MKNVKALSLTDFERDVTISLLNTALNDWDEDNPRHQAAYRVLRKLREVDEVAAQDRD